MRQIRRLVGAATLTLALGASPAWAASGPAPKPATPQPAAHHAGSSNTGRDAGEIVGFIGLVGIVVAWTEGYGLLGGRTRRRVQLPAAGPASADA